MKALIEFAECISYSALMLFLVFENQIQISISVCADLQYSTPPRRFRRVFYSGLLYPELMNNLLS